MAEYGHVTTMLPFDWPVSVRQRKPMALPPDSARAPLVVRLGRYYFDDTPLIGKIVDFNMWDRSEVTTALSCVS